MLKGDRMMSVFKCAECGNIVEENTPPEKCVCGAKFSFDEIDDMDEKTADDMDEEELGELEEEEE